MNSRPNIVRAFTISALIAILPFASFADGGPVDETKEVTSSGHVAVNVVRGKVRFVGWDKSSVQVVGILDSRTREFVFDVNGDETTIEVKLDSSRPGWFGSGEESDLTIYLPTLSRMGFSGTSADVDIEGLDKSIEVNVVSGDVHLVGGSSRVTVQTVSGDIFIRDSAGRVKVGTVSGDVDSATVTGNARYSTVSGDIVVEGAGEELRIETVSGEIDVVGGAVSTLGGHSVSGDITVEVQLLDAGSIEFSNVSGSIRLLLKDEANARFDLETGSGSIRNEISKDLATISRYMGDESLQFTVGNGQGQVILSTRSGDVRVDARP